VNVGGDEPSLRLSSCFRISISHYGRSRRSVWLRRWEHILRVMTDRRIRHLPVVDAGTLVGIVSIGDLVKHRIDQLTFERDQLDSYVHQH